MIAGSKSLATPRSVLTGLQPSFAKMGTNSPAAAMKALTSIRISGFDIKGHETDVSHERSEARVPGCTHRLCPSASDPRIEPPASQRFDSLTDSLTDGRQWT